MTHDDESHFAASLGVLAETFGETLTPARLEGYALALRDLPLAEARGAVELALRTCTFFPRPAELRALAGAGAPDAGLVEALLVAHLREPGGDRRMPADPFLRLVVERLGGVRQVAEMPSGVRVGHLRAIVPPVVQAARALGYALPAPTTVTLPAIAHRVAETPALDGPAPLDRDTAATVLAQCSARRSAA